MALDLFKEIQAINRLFSGSLELERIRIPRHNGHITSL